MTTTPRPLVFAVATFALATLAACSSETAVPVPSGDGYVAGGGPSVQAPSPTSSPAPTSTPPAGHVDSGSPGASPGADSGAGGSVDAGQAPTPEAAAPEPDAGSPAQPVKGPLGSCSNPVCGTDLNECGCQATDSNGNTVQMGCQAGGQCICLVNNNETDNPFDENGACGAQASTVEQFLTNCTCQ